MTNGPMYPRDATFGGGIYRLRHRLRGDWQDGLWLDDAVSPAVWIIHRTAKRNPHLDHLLSYSVEGLTALRFIGGPDLDHNQWQGDHTVFVEDAPTGIPVSQAGILTDRECARLGVKLCDVIRRWAAQFNGEITRGLRPETVFLTGEPGNRQFYIAAPRSYFLLGSMQRYGDESVPHVDPPTGSLHYSLHDGLFLVALLLWIARTGVHPYDVPGKSIEHNMFDDHRSAFPFASRLGSLLERMLVADGERRPGIDEFREELTRLA